MDASVSVLARRNEKLLVFIVRHLGSERVIYVLPLDFHDTPTNRGKCSAEIDERILETRDDHSAHLQGLLLFLNLLCQYFKCMKQFRIDLATKFVSDIPRPH